MIRKNYKVFIAYHGTYSARGSKQDAEDLRKYLLNHGFSASEIFFFPSKEGGAYKANVIDALSSHTFILVYNESLKLESDGTIDHKEHYELCTEIDAFYALTQLGNDVGQNDAKALYVGNMDIHHRGDESLLHPLFKDIAQSATSKEDKETAFEGILKWINIRLSIQEKDDNNNQIRNIEFFDDNLEERRRLERQQKFLLKFDSSTYDQHLNDKKNINILDLGCSNGRGMMERLGKREGLYNRLIGIDSSASSIDEARYYYDNKNISFYVVDVESEDFLSKMHGIMKQEGIDGFDFINCQSLLLHLKNPFNVLKSVRSLMNDGGIIFILDVDDGLTLAYPDKDHLISHLFDIDYQLPTTGNRHCGRTIPGLLSLAGYKDIVLEKAGINTCSLTHEERETLFRFNYDFIKAGLEATVKKDPNNREMQNHLNWVIKMGDEMEKRFYSDSFFFTYGDVIITAKK